MDDLQIVVSHKLVGPHCWFAVQPFLATASATEQCCTLLKALVVSVAVVGCLVVRPKALCWGLATCHLQSPRSHGAREMCRTKCFPSTVKLSFSNGGL